MSQEKATTPSLELSTVADSAEKPESISPRLALTVVERDNRHYATATFGDLFEEEALPHKLLRFPEEHIQNLVGYAHARLSIKIYERLHPIIAPTAQPTELTEIDKFRIAKAERKRLDRAQKQRGHNEE